MPESNENTYEIHGISRIILKPRGLREVCTKAIVDPLIVSEDLISHLRNHLAGSGRLVRAICPTRHDSTVYFR